MIYKLLIILFLFTSCAKLDYDINPWTTIVRHMIYADR